MRYKVLLDLVTNQPLAEDAEGLLKSIGEVSLHLSVLRLFVRKKSMGTKLHSHYSIHFTSLQVHCYHER